MFDHDFFLCDLAYNNNTLSIPIEVNTSNLFIWLKNIDEIYDMGCNVSYQKHELFFLISQKRGHITWNLVDFLIRLHPSLPHQNYR